MINHMQRVIEKAAEYEISIIKHEPIKDTGLRRKYPNFISREGAKGQEFNGFSYNEFELVDVRTFEEFQSGHISSAINIDFFSADFIDKIKEFDTSLNLILYCRTDNRSSKSAKILADNDFKNVYVIKGGIEEWISQGNTVSI